jgi:hypothetical protein
MPLTTAAYLVSLALSGCSVIITTGVFSGVSSARSVEIIARVSAHGESVDTVTARITNVSGRAVFVPRCGSVPLLLPQQFVNGAWVAGNYPACSALDALAPIELDPGFTLVAVHVFGSSGRYRLVMTVGETEDFSTSSQSTSNSFAVP